MLVQGNINHAIGRHLQGNVCVRNLVISSEGARDRKVENIALSEGRNITISSYEIGKNQTILQSKQRLIRPNLWNKVGSGGYGYVRHSSYPSVILPCLAASLISDSCS